MRGIIVAMIVVAFAGPAFAQGLNIQDPGKRKTDVDVKQEREREAGYNAGISKIPDPKGKPDPWGNVRGPATPQANPSRPNSK
jgi:hypothetical protein